MVLVKSFTCLLPCFLVYHVIYLQNFKNFNLKETVMKDGQMDIFFDKRSVFDL
jgi:hypothetical protein